jgi:hypothetical protein
LRLNRIGLAACVPGAHVLLSFFHSCMVWHSVCSSARLQDGAETARLPEASDRSREDEEIPAMVTNYPQQLTAIDGPAADTSDTREGLMSRVVARLGQALCGLSGHDAVLHFEGKRVMMRCTSCGHDTPGWEVSERGPRQRFAGDARRHRIGEPRLVLRKTA